MATKLVLFNQVVMHHEPLTTLESLKGFISQNFNVGQMEYNLSYQSPEGYSLLIKNDNDLQHLSKYTQGLCINIQPTQPNQMNMSQYQFMPQYPQFNQMQSGYYQPPPPPPHPMHHGPPPFGDHPMKKWDKCRKGMKEHKIEKIKKLLKEEIRNMIPEIVEMIDEYKNGEQKPQIDEKPQITEKIEVGLRPVHKHVACDGCDMFPIIGTRYKCSVSEDFDFCEKCEATKAHPYPFLKIKEPSQAPAAIITVLRDDRNERRQEESKQCGRKEESKQCGKQEESKKNCSRNDQPQRSRNPCQFFDTNINEDQYKQGQNFMQDMFQNVQEQMILNNQSEGNPVNNFINQVMTNMNQNQNNNQQGCHPFANIIQNFMSGMGTCQRQQNDDEQQQEFKVVNMQDEIPKEWKEADYSYAVQHQDKFRSQLGWNHIVRANTGSFDGPGYEYRHRDFDDRQFGHRLICRDTLQQEEKPQEKEDDSNDFLIKSTSADSVEIKNEKDDSVEILINQEENKQEEIIKEQEVEQKESEKMKEENLIEDQKPVQENVEESIVVEQPVLVQKPKVSQEVQVKAQQIIEMMGGEEETYYGFVWKNPKCTMEQLMNMILEYPELIEQGRKEYEKAQAQEKK